MARIDSDVQSAWPDILTSNFLPANIGLYLHSSEVPRRVRKTLSRLGICSGYKSILNQVHKDAAQPQVGTSDGLGVVTALS
ncbi:hypothetical protein F4774DRAFT_86519 [Daldinia eschscholtzii]|nr:hypothetical protein F4774DRAFT_86519 [Daldinia eschscholtzii]